MNWSIFQIFLKGFCNQVQLQNNFFLAFQVFQGVFDVPSCITILDNVLLDNKSDRIQQHIVNPIRHNTGGLWKSTVEFLVEQDCGRCVPRPAVGVLGFFIQLWQELHSLRALNCSTMNVHFLVMTGVCVAFLFPVLVPASCSYFVSCFLNSGCVRMCVCTCIALGVYNYSEPAICLLSDYYVYVQTC